MSIESLLPVGVSLNLDKKRLRLTPLRIKETIEIQRYFQTEKQKGWEYFVDKIKEGDLKTCIDAIYILLNKDDKKKHFPTLESFQEEIEKLPSSESIRLFEALGAVMKEAEPPKTNKLKKKQIMQGIILIYLIIAGMIYTTLLLEPMATQLLSFLS